MRQILPWLLLTFLGALFFAGCSGEDPAPSPTPAKASPVAQAPSTPTPSPTPEKTGPSPEYLKLQRKADGLVLGGAYSEALPLVEQLAAEQPGDPENQYNLLLCHGWAEEQPTRDSAAYKAAEKVLAALPADAKGLKALRYLACAEITLPKEYGKETRASQGVFDHYPKESYELNGDVPFHADLKPKLRPAGEAELFEALASPTRFPGLKVLPKGTRVNIIKEHGYHYSLNNWRKPMRKGTEPDKTVFDVAAFLVEVMSEGEFQGQKGWLVHHVDHWTGGAGDPWGVWIENQVNLKKPLDLAGEPIDMSKVKVIDPNGGKNLHDWRDEKTKLYGFRSEYGGEGKWVIPPQFKDVAPHGFQGGLCAVLENEKEAAAWGFIDPTGEWVIKPRFQYPATFRNGYAMVTELGPRKRVQHEWHEGHKSGNTIVTDWSKPGRIETRIERETKRRGWIDITGRFFEKEPKEWSQ